MALEFYKKEDELEEKPKQKQFEHKEEKKFEHKEDFVNDAEKKLGKLKKDIKLEHKENFQTNTKKKIERLKKEFKIEQKQVNINIHNKESKNTQKVELKREEISKLNKFELWNEPKKPIIKKYIKESRASKEKKLEKLKKDVRAEGSPSKIR